MSIMLASPLVNADEVGRLQEKFDRTIKDLAGKKKDIQTKLTKLKLYLEDLESLLVWTFQSKEQMIEVKGQNVSEQKMVLAVSTIPISFVQFTKLRTLAIRFFNGRL